MAVRMVRKTMLFIAAILFVIGSAACSGNQDGAKSSGDAGASQAKAANAQAKTEESKPMTLEQLAKYNGPDRQERLLREAKKEGQLSLYTSMPVDNINKIAADFEKKYGIKVTVWRASAIDVAQRTIAEAKGNKFTVDVVELNSTELETVRREKLLQPVVSPLHKNLIPEAISQDQTYAGTRLNITTQAYNTKQIKKEELPKTYEDLLDPKWKGKIVIESKAQEWFADVVTDMGEQKGLEYFKKLVATNGLPNRKGKGLLTELTAAGEVPLALTIYNYRAEQLKSAGAPIDWFVIEPAIARTNAIAVSAKAPHPNAALLFYDYMLGDAQKIMVEMEMVPTNKTVPTELNKFKMKIIDPEKAVDQGGKWDKLFDDIILKKKAK